MTFSIVPAELSPKTFRNPVQKTKEPVVVKCIDRIASGTAIATTVRCPLQQICEWKAMDDRRTMRKLAKAQGIVVSHGATQEVLEEVRKHFREAIAHPEGRLRCPFGIDWENEPGGMNNCTIAVHSLRILKE